MNLHNVCKFRGRLRTGGYILVYIQRQVEIEHIAVPDPEQAFCQNDVRLWEHIQAYYMENGVKGEIHS